MNQYALHIPREYVEIMRSYVVTQAPLEACGVLGGRSGAVSILITVKNAAVSPVRFRMDPLEQLNAFEQIESAGMEILAIFHSHPTGPSVPSPTDIVEAAYPVVQIIWSPVDGIWQMRGFWIEEGHAAEVPLHIDGV